jgi:hypothetical protein
MGKVRFRVRTSLMAFVSRPFIYACDLDHSASSFGVLHAGPIFALWAQIPVERETSVLTNAEDASRLLEGERMSPPHATQAENPIAFV